MSQDTDTLVRSYGFESDPAILVEWRGASGWAVIASPYVLNNKGEWEFEPSPSRRDQEFFERARFPLAEALRLAREHLNKPRLFASGLYAQRPMERE